MVVRVLLLVAAFAALYGCGEASSPPEGQEQNVGVEEPKPKEPKEKGAEAAETLDDYDSDCRFAEYALDASPKQSEKVFDRLADTIEMNVNASESDLNKSKNATLDAMNVPRYPKCAK
jgi:hypothetical protein